MTSSLKSLLRDLRKIGSGIHYPNGVSQVQNLLRSVNTSVGIFNASLRKAIVSQSKHGYLEIGHARTPINRFEAAIRSGDITKVLKITEKNVPNISSKERASFRSLADGIADAHVNDFVKLSENVHSNYPHLNANSVEKLSNRALQDVEKGNNNLYKKFKKGVKITLLFGSTVVGLNFIENHMEAMKGCHLIKSAGTNKNDSCKIANLTCDYIARNQGIICTDAPSTFYNATIWIMDIVQRADDDVTKKLLATHLNRDVATLNDGLKTILEEQFEKVEDFFKNKKTAEVFPMSRVCNIKHKDIDNNTIGTCRMCSTSADPRSPNYIDPQFLGENFSLKCMADPTILDAMSDIYQNATDSVFDGIGTVVKVFKNTMFFGIIFAIIIAIIFIFIKYRNRKPDNNSGDRERLIDKNQSYA